MRIWVNSMNMRRVRSRFARRVVAFTLKPLAILPPTNIILNGAEPQQVLLQWKRATLPRPGRLGSFPPQYMSAMMQPMYLVKLAWEYWIP